MIWRGHGKTRDRQAARVLNCAAEPVWQSAGPPSRAAATAASAGSCSLCWCSRRRTGRRRLVVAVGHDPFLTVRIGAIQDVGSADRFHFLRAARVHDRGRHASADDHRNKAGVDAVAVRQSEGNVGKATGGVDLQLFTEAAQQRKYLLPRSAHGTDRHDERVDDDVVGRNAVIGGALDDFLGNGEAHVRILGNAGVVVGDRNDRHIVFLDQRQDEFQPLFLARDRVQQRAAMRGGQPDMKATQ